MHKIENIPTNIITGALGAGKTTLIQALLAQKPANERWAVLVNEFGEIGIDGAILADSQSNNVFIKEVPGGCMCCTSGLPMQIALNMLLARARPHRLLIEPTGLGHPKEVMQTLTAPHYQEVLDVRSTLTLIDIRKLRDERWREHPTFQEQLQIADHIVATKSDLYEGDLSPVLAPYMQNLGIKNTPVSFCTQGQIDIDLLKPKTHFSEGVKGNHDGHTHQHVHSHELLQGLSNEQGIAAPVEGALKVENSGEGYYSCGWVCAPSQEFNYQQVVDTLLDLQVERVKAVLRTNKGPVTFNLSDGDLNITMLDEAADSRIEFLTRNQALAAKTSELLEAEFDLINTQKLKIT